MIDSAQLLKQEKKITSRNLALVLVHDLLLAKGIQAGDGPIKQAVLRHKTRLTSEFTRAKLKRGAKSNEELAQTDDSRACMCTLDVVLVSAEPFDQLLFRGMYA